MRVLACLGLAACARAQYYPNPVPNPEALVFAGNTRFTVLTPALLRLQYVEGGAFNQSAFDDRASAIVINRYTAAPQFTVAHPTPTSVVITTSALTLSYDFSVPPPPSDGAACGFPREDHGVLGGTPLPSFPFGLNDTTQSMCCVVCSADADCVAWVFYPATSFCKLLVMAPTVHYEQGAVSGWIYAPFSADSLRIDFAVAGAPASWAPGAVDPDNLLGTFQKSECYTSPLACYNYMNTALGQGLVSRNGWYLLDDTRTFRLVGTPLPSRPQLVVPWHAPPSTDSADWYFFGHGHEYKGALADFVAVSGAAALPPAAAFGVAWSRWYTYTAESVMEEVVGGFAAHGLPLNTLTLDMDWHAEVTGSNGTWPTDPGTCNTWGSFDFNKTLFPDPLGFSQTVKNSSNPMGYPLALSLNFHDSVGVDPCSQRYAAVAQALGRDPAANVNIPCQWHNISYVDGIYGVYMEALPLSLVDAQWADWGGCDPPNRAPYNPVAGQAGGSSAMDVFSNLWWANHVMGVFQETAMAKRPWNLYRFGGLGQQRYPVGFSGDTFQDFFTLQWEAELIGSAANVVFPYWSFDIGGYMCYGGDGGCDANTTSFTGSELLTRWYQFGAFSPMFRTHCRQCERRIWLFPYYQHLKDALLMRNALFPYLYSEARATFDTGLAAVHPMYYEWPELEEAYSVKGQYMLGARVLVAPITAAAQLGEDGLPGPAEKAVFLPPGAWSNWNGSALAMGPAWLPAQAYGLGDVPVFAAAGALLPLKTMDSVWTGEGVPNPLVWAAFPFAPNTTGTSSYALYEDDGVSLSYKSAGTAQFCNTTGALSLAALEAASTLTFTVTAAGGGFPGWIQTRTHWVQLRGKGALAPPLGNITVNGQAVAQCPGGVAPAQPRTAAECWWVVGEQDHALAAPAASLVVSTGPQNNNPGATTVVRLTW